LYIDCLVGAFAGLEVGLEIVGDDLGLTDVGVEIRLVVGGRLRTMA
jgi:hypothetical protein